MKKSNEATLNEIVRESIKESGHYTAYTTCPKCGATTMGLLTKVNDDTVLYTTLPFGIMCGHKVNQLIKVTDDTDFNKIFSPIEEEEEEEVVI